jgi:hypothetical protein
MIESANKLADYAPLRLRKLLSGRVEVILRNVINLSWSEDVFSLVKAELQECGVPSKDDKCDAVV